MEFLKSAMGLTITHVPFKGTGQSVPALVAGQVPMVFSAFPSHSAYAKDGRVKLLVANSLKRSGFAKNIPTIAETVPGFDFAPTIGIFAPWERRRNWSTRSAPTRGRRSNWPTR